MSHTFIEGQRFGVHLLPVPSYLTLDCKTQVIIPYKPFTVQSLCCLKLPVGIKEKRQYSHSVHSYLLPAIAPGIHGTLAVLHPFIVKFSHFVAVCIYIYRPHWGYCAPQQGTDIEGEHKWSLDWNPHQC